MPAPYGFHDYAEREHCSTAVRAPQEDLRFVNAILFALLAPPSALPPSCSCGRPNRSHLSDTCPRGD